VDPAKKSLRILAPPPHFNYELKHLAKVLFCGCLALPAPASSIIWDFGPSSGDFVGQYSNISGSIFFADRVVFTVTTVVDGYIHFTPANVSSKGFEFRILADNGGTPGATIADFHETFTGTPVFADYFGPSSIYKVQFTWAKPVTLAPGAYWFGASGDGFNAYQFTVNKPGDGQTAQFYSSGYSGMVAGDQLFQLTGYYRTASSAEAGTALLAATGVFLLAARWLWKRRKRPLKTGPVPARQII